VIKAEQDLPGTEGGRRGTGAGGKMSQTMYAHVNKRRKKKISPGQMALRTYSLRDLTNNNINSRKLSQEIEEVETAVYDPSNYTGTKSRQMYYKKTKL
jgi:hypothetical protein